MIKIPLTQGQFAIIDDAMLGIGTTNPVHKLNLSRSHTEPTRIYANGNVGLDIKNPCSAVTSFWHYIVQWQIRTIVYDPCPDANKKDKFGVEINFVCCVLHYHYSYSDINKKEFLDRARAFEFYQEALKRGDLTKVHIDSTLTKVKK